jgi:immune inhibitor A
MRRAVSVGTVLAVAAAALATVSVAEGRTSPEASASALAAVDKPLWREARDYYSTLRAPRVVPTGGPEALADEKGAPTWWEVAERRHSTGFPAAAQELARREALADRSGRSPARILRASGAAPVTRAKLLTLLVEFNPQANDDFSGWEKPDDPLDPVDCITEPAGTLLNGPVHNELPNPATLGRGLDNNTFWVPDFSPSHYRKIIYSRTGLTQRVRPDLHGGVDLRGYTVRNHYAEMSKGAYELGGTVTPWLMLPHSEAWYSADSCAAGPASDIGHPDNPRGTGQMAIDAVQALADADPDFPFADYDVEDQGDLDGDGDLFEPDGVLDHVVVIHAGADQADNGGEQETYAEWSSSQVVDAATGGFEVPGTGVKVFNYTTQPEDAGVGVISHEYGHDLGLPDLYDSIGPTDTDVGWWDLMSTGSHSGPLFQAIPTHMGAWSKYVLGWITPKVLKYGAKKARVTLGQAAKVPRGSKAAVKIKLPDKTATFGEPHSGRFAWWTGKDQADADVRLTRSVDVPSGGDVRFWMWNSYTIEELWDYGFVEVSTDGGSTWTQLEVFDEAGTMVSTDEDPNGNLQNYFGGLENGLTGDSGGYRHDYVDLTPYAGTTIKLRLRYATDPVFQERGWFADDFSVTADGAVVWSDDVEGGNNGWTPVVSTWTSTTGEGWKRSDGTADYQQYYLVEWRTNVGFDKGLRTPYSTQFSVGREWRVNRMPYNAPGLLIWQRDSAYNANDVNNHLFDAPSIGAKGQVLLVDAHFDPARLRGAAAAANPSLLDNLDSRAQANDVAFGRIGRYPFKYCYPSDPDDPYAAACNWFGKRSKVKRFTDARTWYPGMEYRPDLDAKEPLFFRDVDASTVIPSRGNRFYSTRIVDAKGRPVRKLFGTDLGDGQVLGTGDPRDGRPATDSNPGTERDLSLGVKVVWVKSKAHNRKAVVMIRPGRPR